MYLLYSTDDMKSVIDSVGTIKEKVKGLKIISFEGKGHFDIDQINTDKFPELLGLLI